MAGDIRRGRRRGRDRTLSGIEVFRVRDGRITEVTCF